MRANGNTDPSGVSEVCLGAWAENYASGYTKGGNDRCALTYEYIDVATSADVTFCTVTMGLGPPPPTLPVLTYAPVLPTTAKAAQFSLEVMEHTWGMSHAVHRATAFSAGTVHTGASIRARASGTSTRPMAAAMGL